MYLKPGPKYAQITRHPGMGDNEAALIGGALGVGILGGIMNAVVAGIIVYGGARLIGKEPAGARKAAYWGAGIAGVTTVALAGIAGATAASQSTTMTLPTPDEKAKDFDPLNPKVY